jgi:hypothetical protein
MKNFITSTLFSFIALFLVGIDASVAVPASLGLGAVSQFVVLPSGVLASQVATLNASNPTTIFFTGHIPELILVDAVDTDLVVDSITVDAEGVNYQNVEGQAIIQAMSKVLMAGNLGVNVRVGQVLKIADGQVPISAGQQCRVVLGNAGATTPNVYAISDSVGRGAFRSSQDSINNLANANLSGMDFLFFEDSNFSKADILFNDGHSESDVTLVELNMLFTASPLTKATDADGKLAGVNVVDLNGSGIAEIKLYASGGSLPFYTLNI